MSNITLGLDVGIASLGWALINQTEGRLIDFGVRMFDQANPASDARLNRSARRTLRRKKWRKEQLKQAFIDFGLLTKEEIASDGFLSYTTNNELFHRPKDETIHHLRMRAISEAVTIRELFLALYNICGTRGHFFMESIDFSNDSITYPLFEQKFFELVSEHFLDYDIKSFNETVLKPLFENGKIPSKEITAIFKSGFSEIKEIDDALSEIIKLLSGYKADLAKIGDFAVLEDVKGKVNVMDLVKRDSLNDFLDFVVELHDIISVSQILKEHDFICEKNVSELNRIKEVYKMELEDPEAYKENVKDIQSKMSGKLGRRLRVIRNMSNKYPNGLYVKEARAILKRQQTTDPRITDEFIEVIITIISARIPYYVGPLTEFAKNSWLVRPDDSNIKYSYDYSRSKIDEFKTIQAWKKAMISHCTYLPDELALPKGSFVAETFNILNELNILKAVDQNKDNYQLSQEDKIQIFDELFLMKETVSFKDIVELLDLSYFGPVNKGKMVKMNARFTLYHKIVTVLPDLKVNSILELFTNPDKINKLEEIILNINLFDEEVSKKKYFMNDCKMNSNISSVLSRLKSNGFYAFSRKFILETSMDEKGNSLLELLFEDNDSQFKNEQMYRITNAKDKDGNLIHFDSNKYMKKLNKGDELSIDLLIDNGKPFIPVSRPVIRSLNQCFKVYNEIVRTYGIPDRIVIETAKDLITSKDVKKRHDVQMKSNYESLMEQIKIAKKSGRFIKSELDSWDAIEQHLAKNKRKIELYISQNGKDIISGDSIDLNHLENYEIDHILPRGFGVDSMDNKMLIHREYNSKKSNRLPLEYIEQESVRNKAGEPITSKNFIARCNELKDLNAIRPDKFKQLMLSSTDDAMGFINRNLVDTHYIVKELMAMLNAFHKVNGYNSHIVALKSSFTNAYRNAFQIRKNREIGDQHHAYDAAVVAIADQVLSHYYPGYDKSGNYKRYQDFLKDLENNVGKKYDERDDFNQFIRFAYKATYGNYPNDNDSLISEIKDRVPLYSVKENKNYKGKLFNATLYAPNLDARKPLDILGVNNEKRSFSDIECVAVDFFKYTNKKGKKQHVAIHIPKCIVNDKGEINKEKYIKLIREYYKVPELLDENGEIKEYYFRLRCFRNELIYDTNNFTIQKFNIGSIVNKKLEMKHIYNFSYDDIYKRVAFYRKNLAEQFDFKLPKINPNGQKKFDDYKIQEIINYSIDNMMDIKDIDRYRKNIEKYLCGTTNYQQFLEKMAFVQLIINRKCTWPNFLGQYCPRVSTPGDDFQYVKLKSSILGIRYEYNEKGTLIISGPKYASNKYSKIKKEKFTWNLANPVLS